MKKILTVLATALVISAILVTSLGVTAFAKEGKYGHQVPAPNSGDCIPDGSGFDRAEDVGFGPGPAPNSGDGIPDGSGF